MVEQVLPRIYHICVPLVGNPLKELNSYLIKDDGRNLLIDTGFRRNLVERHFRLRWMNWVCVKRRLMFLRLISMQIIRD